MTKALLIAIAILPLSASADSLYRTYRHPKPSPIKLVKNFYETREVDSTCYETKCQNEWTTCYRSKCHDESYTEQVCHMEYVCRNNDSNGEYTCDNWDNVCRDESRTREVCENEGYDCREERCWDESYTCKETKQVLVRSWKAVVKTNFDPKAVPKKDKDEKFTITLDGDEHEPKLEVKKVRGPYNYVVEPRFSDDRKTVEVEFRLAPTPPQP